MKRIAIMCVLAPMILISTTTHAEYTIKQYHDIRAAGGDAWNKLTLYIVGFATGFNYADAMHVSRHAPPLDCPPVTGLRDLTYVDMLDEIIQRKKLPDTVAIETALTYAIPEAFPCKK
jgi:hypothetical protein